MAVGVSYDIVVGFLAQVVAAAVVQEIVRAAEQRHALSCPWGVAV